MRLAERCRTVIKSEGIFKLHPTTVMDSFSCILFFRRLYLSLSMCFILSILHCNKYIFDQEMFGSAFLLTMTCTMSSYTPWYKTEISRTGENRGKSCWVCKKYINPTCHSFTWDTLRRINNNGNRDILIYLPLS